MGRKILILLLTFFAVSAMANGSDWNRQQENNKTRAEKTMEERQQRMEILESENLEEEKTQEEKARHDAEKQKFLYEHDGYYRRGL